MLSHISEGDSLKSCSCSLCAVDGVLRVRTYLAIMAWWLLSIIKLGLMRSGWLNSGHDKNSVLTTHHLEESAGRLALLLANAGLIDHRLFDEWCAS